MGTATPSEAPVRERHVAPGWVAAVRSEVGLVRNRLEDAWRVLPDVSAAGRRSAVFAVFDGLGGLPYGREAATAAAEHAPEALARAPALEQTLGFLNNWVRETQGATTAVVAVFPHGGAGEGTILSAGDSAAYGLDEAGAVRLLTPKDAEGPYVVTDCLGRPDLGGHTTPCRVGRGRAILLCTDGVDGVVEPDALARTLAAADVAAALDDLLADVLERGAPDNATVVLARRTA